MFAAAYSAKDSVSARRAALLAGTILGCLLVFQSPMAVAQTPEFCDRTTEDCDRTLRGAVMDRSAVDTQRVGENTEQGFTVNEGIPLWITVDGQPLALDGVAPAPQTPEDVQRVEDLRLEAVDIQVRFDGLDVEPILNVSTRPVERLIAPGSEVEFFGSWNYPGWIAAREVRITDERSILFQRVPMSENGTAVWTAPDLISDAGDGEFGKRYSYTLRVYDAEGRFDETVPLPLKVTDEDMGTYVNRDEQGRPYSEAHFNPRVPGNERFEEVPGYGEDRTAIRNIPVHGGMITVYGRNVPEGHEVTAFGRRIPLDPERKFVMQEIVRPGTEAVRIAVLDAAGEGLRFEREVMIPENEFFYVGLVDLAIGRNFRHEDRIEAIDGDDRDRFYTSGRAAMYLKGKIRGKYLLTGAIDTGDEEIEDLLRNLDEKDPRHLLRRLDPDDYYPVYGDDSTSFEDAPTRGKFYVRLERGDSHVMWGNFKTRITGSEFGRHERGLYGAHALYRSEASTSFGDRRVTAHAFAAEPGTLPQHDVFRGTGGSAYFLKRQDITVGSETLTIDIRDRITGLSKTRRILRPEEDYDVDYFQGVIILREPLESSVSAGEIVRDDPIGGDEVFLLASYEYTPTTGDIDDYALGVRAEGWLTETIRFGASGFHDRIESGEDQTLIEGDVTLRLSERSYLEGEVAVSEGPGIAGTTSVDGGFRFVDDTTIGTDDDRAFGVRVRGVADLEDLGSSLPGQVGVQYERREAGFVALDRATDEDTQIYGAFADVEVSENIRATARYDDIDRDDTGVEREGAAQVEARLSPQWSAGAGITVSDRDLRNSSDDNAGMRADIGGQLTYEQPGYKLYGFGQVTAAKDGDREDNHRIGFGAEVDLSDRFSIRGEASIGSLGFGALAGIDYEPTVDQRYYFGYRLDADRTDGDLDGYDPFGRDTGSFVFGAKRKITESLSVYGEENFDLIGHRQSLTHTYGVTYTPNDVWRFHGAAESGSFDDDQGDDFDRTAISAGIDFSDIGMRFALRGEARFEDSDDSNRQDRETYLVSSSAGYDLNPDWRAIVQVDAVVSNSDESAVLDGDYVEGSLGFAYRPVTNNRLNALGRYTFLYDLPGPEQENAAGETLGPKQRSHIVSLDATYDINEIVSIGGKYGFRFGEISDSRIEDDFVESTAHLGVLRLDLHVVKNWDALLEGRILHLPEAQSTRYGALAAIYRHFGDNLKIGVGYNFADFSDDLTDVTYDNQGVFLNVIGKF